MFLGMQDLNLDAKNRISIPSKYRSQIEELAGGHVVVLPSLPVASGGGELCYEPSLWVYTMDGYTRLAERVDKFPAHEKNVIKLRHIVYKQAEMMSLDSAGRVTLSSRLKEYAGIEKEIRIQGSKDKLEIWDLATCLEYEARLEEQPDEGLSLGELMTDLAGFY